MSILKDALLDGLAVGVGVPLLGKGHEIAMATKKAHGTMLRWDAGIVKTSLIKNPRMTITAAVVAASVFTAGSWLNRVVTERKTIELRSY